MPIYFTNYCPSEAADRATETRVHFRLKEAREFMRDRRGYIIRQWRGMVWGLDYSSRPRAYRVLRDAGKRIYKVEG